MLHIFHSTSLFLCSQYLPKEELYTPPMNIKVHDNRSFGRKPVVGIHSMKSMKKFRCEPASMDEPADLPTGQLIGAKPPLLYSFVLLQLMIRGDMSS